MSDDETRETVKPAASMLRILKSAPSNPADVQRDQRDRLADLLRRVEHISATADPVTSTGSADVSKPHRAPEPPQPRTTPKGMTDVNLQAEQRPRREPSLERPGTTAPDEVNDGETGPETVLWWISFSGNVSLRRLSRLRQRMRESPFTVDTWFAEIGDGLIVLQIETDATLTEPRLEWILGHLMDAENLDRNAMIVSRG